MSFLLKSSRRVVFWLPLLILVLLYLAVKGWKPLVPRRDNELYQVSTLDALSLGLYQGALSYHDLEHHGDFGLGTFDSLDGEMVALDGRFYQVRSDGTIQRVSGNSATPFATVTMFETDLQLTINRPTTLAQLTARSIRPCRREIFLMRSRFMGASWT